MNSPVSPSTRKESDHPESLADSRRFSPEIRSIPYADCIFRDGYSVRNEWDVSWVEWLKEEPWKTDRVYREQPEDIKLGLVFLGIFFGVAGAPPYPEFIHRVVKLSDKFIYLIGQFGKVDDFRALAFTPLEWIALRRLEERYSRDAYPRIREVFDTHFGDQYREGHELKERMEKAIQEIRNIADGCFTLEHVKEDIQGLLFHAGLEDISQNTACIESMATTHFACLKHIFQNYLDDLGEFKRQFFEWNDSNNNSFMKA